MKRFLIAAALLTAISAQAVEFGKNFADSTLRVDYSFAHDPQKGSSIYVEQLQAVPGWAGRRNHLGELPLKGNGSLIVRDAETLDTIYATSFTTLFHEWLTSDESKSTPKAFSYSFLAPLPKKKAWIEIDVIDKHQKPIAQARHLYDPADILVRQWQGKAPEAQYLHKGGSPAEAIDVAILPEGYTEKDMPLFFEDARKVVDAILGHEPFKSMAGKFNFLAVPLASTDGEVSHPLRNEWHDTRYDCHYSTLYSDRYMTTPSSVKAHDDLRGLPYEHIIILANTEQYGGGGFYNVITTAAAHHPTMPNVVTHEFGHSFGGLADEYFYPGEQMSDLYTEGVEPWEQNITNLTDFNSKPWSGMLSEGAPVPTDPADSAKYPVGLYEGGGYLEKGMYRPADKCRMRTNDYPDFCPVCTDALVRLIEFYTE